MVGMVGIMHFQRMLAETLLSIRLIELEKLQKHKI